MFNRIFIIEWFYCASNGLIIDLSATANEPPWVDMEIELNLR